MPFTPFTILSYIDISQSPSQQLHSDTEMKGNSHSSNSGRIMVLDEEQVNNNAPDIATHQRHNRCLKFILLPTNTSTNTQFQYAFEYLPLPFKIEDLKMNTIINIDLSITHKKHDYFLLEPSNCKLNQIIKID